MNKFKYLFVLLIIFSIFTQFGKVFLKNTQYEKIYKFISSFFIIFIVFMCIFPIGKNIMDINYSNEISLDSNKTDIKKEFENRLSQTIERNIHNIFYVNYIINVETDFSHLQIYITAKETAMDNDVKNYIISNYCTSKDEVYLISENE
jgi:hypothetical protein